MERRSTGLVAIDWPHRSRIEHLFDTNQPSQPTLVVITGPIASGKSTVAAALARELGSAGVQVAVIDLDLLHDRLAPPGGDPAIDSWTLARRAAASAARAYIDGGAVVIVAEGSFNGPTARAEFTDGLHESIAPLFVTLRVSFDEAQRRALGDPTRGPSRDPAFLRPYFAAVDRVLAAVPDTDVIIDTERTPPAAAAEEIARLIRGPDVP